MANPMPFLDNLDIRELGGGKFMLLHQLRYETPDTREILIAHKYQITDFASIPRAMRWFISGAGHDNTIKPAVIHDRDYRDKHCKRTRKRVDQIFLMGMKEAGTPYLKRWAAYIGVRSGGWIAWNAKRDK